MKTIGLSGIFVSFLPLAELSNFMFGENLFLLLREGGVDFYLCSPISLIVVQRSLGGREAEGGEERRGDPFLPSLTLLSLAHWV